MRRRPGARAPARSDPASNTQTPGLGRRRRRGTRGQAPQRRSPADISGTARTRGPSSCSDGRGACGCNQNQRALRKRGVVAAGRAAAGWVRFLWAWDLDPALTEKGGRQRDCDPAPTVRLLQCGRPHRQLTDGDLASAPRRAPVLLAAVGLDGEQARARQCQPNAKPRDPALTQNALAPNIRSQPHLDCRFHICPTSLSGSEPSTSVFKISCAESIAPNTHPNYLSGLVLDFGGFHLISPVPSHISKAESTRAKFLHFSHVARSPPPQRYMVPQDSIILPFFFFPPNYTCSRWRGCAGGTGEGTP